MSNVSTFRQYFNKFPEFFIFGPICILALPIGLYIVNEKEKARAFTYRRNYTVWRHDDPRALQMQRKMEKYNWQPEIKPDMRPWRFWPRIY